MSVVPDDHGDRGLRLSKDDATARALIEAIDAGGVDSLGKLLGEQPGLATARLVDEKGESGTALHAATDWPGLFPNGPEIGRTLMEAGADPQAAVEPRGADLNGTPSWGDGTAGTGRKELNQASLRLGRRHVGTS
jgi:hypothetical protein